MAAQHHPQSPAILGWASFYKKKLHTKTCHNHKKYVFLYQPLATPSSTRTPLQTTTTITIYHSGKGPEQKQPNNMDAANNVFNFPFCAIVLVSSMGQEALGAIIDLRWMLAAILLLMTIDTAYSYAEHIKDEHQGKHTDKWSTSGALRRYGGKIGTYLSFLIIGCIIGLAFTEPIHLCSHIATSAIGASFAIICEVLSIAGHYLHLKDIYITLSPTKFVKSLIIGYVEQKSETVGKTLRKELKIEHKDGNTKERKPRRSRKTPTATPQNL